MENSVKALNSNQVVIIGAGPAGLCMAFHLKKWNIPFLIVEKEAEVGASWRKMPDHLHLITFWKSNFLIAEDKNLFNSIKRSSAGEFADYLAAFQKKHGLKIRFNCKVEKIEQDISTQQIALTTSQGTMKARVVVDCRGFFNFPYTPSYNISGNPPFMIHFKDYKNKAQLAGYKNILIVGKRLSAGQLISELSSTGTHRLFLSVRSVLQFGPPQWLLDHFLRHLDIYEKLAVKFSSNIKRNAEVPMDHAVKKLLKNVTLVPDIERVDDKNVYFKNGRCEQIDAIVFATGFQPPAVKLKNDFESSEIPNLFYLGRNSQRTFASRFIRGIREDAEILGKEIRGIFESSKSSQ